MDDNAMAGARSRVPEVIEIKKGGPEWSRL